MTPHSRGFVYVATGDSYREEAARSAAGLRALHPRDRICLVTDRAEGPAFWDDLIVLERPSFGFADKLAMRLAPYERSVFLDTDTTVVGDLSELFALLERFDFAGHQLFEGHDYPADGVPDAFPEFNSGVLAFRRGPACAALFDRWERLYPVFLARNRDGAYRPENVSDQQSLRVAAYESGARLAVLGPEYNFVPQQVNFACAAVRVLHGRGRASALAGRINARLGNRVYLPLFDAVVSEHTPLSELLRLLSLASLQMLRLAGRAVVPFAARERLRRSRAVRRLFLRNDHAERTEQHASVWREPPA